MYIIVVFDTEDIYYPASYRIDDIAGWTARIMTEEGIRGIYFTMGDKVKSLLERGRHDVLEAMGHHDLASHQQGNRYPLLPQVVEGKSWEAGLAAIRDYEAWVTEQFVTAWKREPCAHSRHNYYFAPHHVAHGAERGLPYAYNVAQIPGSTQPLWYAGAVTFPALEGTFIGGWQDVFSRTELFDERLAQLDVYLEACLEKGTEWSFLFTAHPLMLMARGWLEHHTIANGIQRSPAELGWQYAIKDRSEEAVAQQNFRRLCAHLAAHPDVEVVGISEAGKLYATQPEVVDRDRLVHYTRQMAESREIVMHDVFSPGELLCALADAFLHCREHGDLPERVPRREVLGPVSNPAIGQELNQLSREDLLAACSQVVAAVETTGHLPANLEVQNGRLGLGQLHQMACRAYQAEARYDRFDRLVVPQAARYPELAYEYDQWVRRFLGDHWAMPLDYSPQDLALHARLQTWTAKPAWRLPPMGRPTSQPYALRCPWP